jgi:hypothetical protein
MPPLKLGSLLEAGDFAVNFPPINPLGGLISRAVKA